MSKKAVPIERRHAERLEDNWAEPFWEKHAQDMQDGFYVLYDASDRGVAVAMEEGCMTLMVRNGEALGDADDEKAGFAPVHCLDEDRTHYVLKQLRLAHSLRNKLTTILAKEFGSDDGAVRFKKYCDALGVACECKDE